MELVGASVGFPRALVSGVERLPRPSHARAWPRRWGQRSGADSVDQRTRPRSRSHAASSSADSEAHDHTARRSSPSTPPASSRRSWPTVRPSRPASSGFDDRASSAATTSSVDEPAITEAGAAGRASPEGASPPPSGAAVAGRSSPPRWRGAADVVSAAGGGVGTTSWGVARAVLALSGVEVSVRVEVRSSRLWRAAGGVLAAAGGALAESLGLSAFDCGAAGGRWRAAGGRWRAAGGTPFEGSHHREVSARSERTDQSVQPPHRARRVGRPGMARPWSTCHRRSATAAHSGHRLPDAVRSAATSGHASTSIGIQAFTATARCDVPRWSTAAPRTPTRRARSPARSTARGGA